MIIHVGYALTKIDPAEARRTLKLLCRISICLKKTATGACGRVSLVRECEPPRRA
ncbi:hypothetical protein [Bradyrhizobium sp. CCGB01]|uniref:hypothetical protein n=1 Tax=Bradyrhizobium sp. CCGB01 TaxID=2949634 RepID=UPI0035C6F07F